MAFEGMRVAVVIPAFEEEALIGRAVTAVPTFVDEVVVVDDGSTDRTADRARSVGDARVRVVSHETNRGVGAAIATGYRWAFSQGADVVAVMAGDAQMDPEDLPALLGPIVRGHADYAKGDRLAHPAALRTMPVQRWIGNHVLSFLTRVALGSADIRDSQCGYTALSRRAGQALDLDAIYPRYGYPNDLCARIVEAGLVIAQPTVRPVYGSEKSGITLRTALVRIPLLIARLFWRRVARTLGAAPARLEESSAFEPIELTSRPSPRAASAQPTGCGGPGSG